MKYEEMSDFEINKLVAINLGYKLREKFKWEESQCWVKVGMEKLPSKIFDYCGNPSDAWPIIEMVWERLMSPPYRGFGTTWERLISEFKCGKLRAAMICFLKMKDAE